MSLIAELKRRKVFKVGAAYLVVAWLAVQAASIGFPAFDAPPWVLRVFILIALLGFPIAVVMAWVFDVTPEGVKLDASTSGSKRLFAAAALLIVLALGWYFYGHPSFRKGDVATPTHVATMPAVPSVDPHSIAVLPFLNMSGDKDNEYFSDGISEELLNVLVRVNGFSVASRTSSFAFKGREIGAPEIAKDLKVKFVLEGSVRKQGDQVRITAQLIDAINDRHLWSETYDRKMTDIFKIQDEIANAIVTAVRKSTGQATTEKAVEVRADTVNLNAYDSYLKARELFIARSDLKESIRLYEHAVELDPNFARGWEGLGAVEVVAESWGVRDRNYSTLAAQAAERALQLDPSLSMPWATLGSVETKKEHVDWAKALSLEDRAIKVDPRNATAYHWRGNYLVKLGYFSRGVSDEDTCLKLDPAYQNCIRWKASALVFAGDSKNALALYEQGIDKGYVHNRAADFVPSLIRRGNTLAAKLILLEQGTPPDLAAIFMQTLASPNASRPDAQAIIKRYAYEKDTVFDQSIGRPLALMWLGAFDLVGSSDDIADNQEVVWIPGQTNWRNSPGFKKLLERSGVADYWRAHGFPPQCHAVGAKDFVCDAVKP